jgi:hypothetical protein
MVRKKAYGCDSPLRQGAGKSFWTLPISGRRWRQLAICFWKSDQPLGFFSLRRIYRWRGGVRKWTRGSPLVARLGLGPRRPRVWPAPGPPPSHLRTSSRVCNNRRFGFCFVQFREYFMCSFSKTQKQQKIGNMHYGISLIG